MDEKLKPKFKGKAIIFCLVLLVAAFGIGYEFSSLSTRHNINQITGDFAKVIEEKDNQLIQLKDEIVTNNGTQAASSEESKKINSLEAENERLASVNSDLKYNNEVYRKTIEELSNKIEILRSGSHSGGGGSYIPSSPSGY